MTRNEHRLVRELKAAKVGSWYARAAKTLLQVNGIENALEYVQGVQERMHPKQMKLPLDGDREYQESLIQEYLEFLETEEER